MSNPVAYFYAADHHDRQFRVTWLERALPPAVYSTVMGLPVSLLRDIYKPIYAYGPEGFRVERLLRLLNDQFDLWLTTQTGRGQLLSFAIDLNNLFEGRYPLLSTTLRTLNDAGRPIEIYVSAPVGHARSEPQLMRLRDNNALLQHVVTMDKRAHLHTVHNLETLLSLTGAYDMLMDENYANLRKGYINFLCKWHLDEVLSANHQ